MFSEFIDSWPLFHHSYLAGLAMAVLLALTGVMVVARGQIFLGAAVAQASTLGIAVVLWLSGISAAWHERLEHWHGLTHVAGIAASIAAAWLAGRETQPGRESREGRTAWIFLLGSGASVLLMAKSPHGLEEIHRLQSSSLIGATVGDVVAFAALAGIAIAAVMVFGRRLLLLAVDPVMAAATGMQVARWTRGLGLWVGLTIGASIYSAGLLFTFGCLVLPALLARSLCREMAPMFRTAAICAFVATLTAFVLANHFDFPPGQLAVALMAVALPLAWSVRHLRAKA